MYYKIDNKTINQDHSNEEFIILSHIVQKLRRINHFRAKFKRTAEKILPPERHERGILKAALMG
jgi:hypothetical protein